MPNRKLVGILVVVMFIAIIGTFVSLFQDKITGFATTGTVQVGITASQSLTVNSNVYFGNGTISPVSPYTTVSTEETDNPNSFNNCTVINGGVDDAGRDCMGIEVENNGNVYINVTMYSDKTYQTFFDSPSDLGGSFNFAVLDGNRSKNETDIDVMGFGNGVIGALNASCQVGGKTSQSIQPKGSKLDGSYMNWTGVNGYQSVGTAYMICGNLSFTDKNDTITVEFNLSIPGDEPTGTKIMTFTYTGTQVD